MTPTTQLLLGAVAGAGLLPLLGLLFSLLHVTVEEGEAVLVTRFGKLEATLTRPGLHRVADRWLPWVKLQHVSLRSQFREMNGICVNDVRGTSVIVDVWVEQRIQDPAKALFQVTDWDAALRNLVSHAVISILGNRDFTQILRDRTELGAQLKQEIAAETARWGLQVESVFLRNVSLRPEVGQQLLQSVAARLERAKADIEEDGRQRVALLDGETSANVAKLVAEAKAQYPLAVGRALERLKGFPEVLAAYEELYELSIVRPHRTIAFRGFDDGEVRAMDAAMATAGNGNDGLSPLSGQEDLLLHRHPSTRP